MRGQASAGVLDALRTMYDTALKMTIEFKLASKPEPKKPKESPKKLEVTTTPPTTAERFLLEFIAAAPVNDERLHAMSLAVAPFVKSSERMLPTSWSKTPVPMTGMELLDAKSSKMMTKFRKLCAHQRIKFTRELEKSPFRFHYGKFDANKKLVTGITLCIAKLNRTPGSIMVSVDIAVSICSSHSMSVAIESLQKTLAQRKQFCVLTAQVAQTESARAFWSGKLTTTRRASVATVLLTKFDPRYKTYGDADDMALAYQ